jgi:hypothetical protein
VTRGRSLLHRLARVLPLTAVFLVVMAGAAVADIQATPNTPPDSSNCSLSGPSSQCGQWTYWAALGAILIGVVAVALFVIKYLRDAPRFQVDAPGATAAGRGAVGASRPLAPPPPATRAAPAQAAAAAPAGGAEPAAAQAGGATAVAVAEPPPAQTEQESAPAVSASPAGQAVATRPPSPRAEPAEPDQETYDRVLAEQLAKGTDRRVAEGRAKAAALKAGREKAAT